MTFMLNRIGRPVIALNAEGGGTGGGEGGTGTAPPSPETVLFPDENKGGGDEGGENKPPAPAGQGDWKEYENDPSKTPEENAAAKAEHDKSKPGDDLADKVPEDGKYTLTMPEGVELDAAMLDALAPDFKEMGLTNGQVQKLAGKFTEIMQRRADDITGTPEGAWSSAAHEYFKKNGTPDKWGEAAKADKDIGGDKWDATVQNATRFANIMGTPALKEFLNSSGAGNHPELIRVFAKAGELIREDSPPAGGAGGNGKPASAAYTLFPNDVPKG